MYSSPCLLPIQREIFTGARRRRLLKLRIAAGFLAVPVLIGAAFLLLEVIA